jgi:hypothetical protein
MSLGVHSGAGDRHSFLNLELLPLHIITTINIMEPTPHPNIHSALLANQQDQPLDILQNSGIAVLWRLSSIQLPPCPQYFCFSLQLNSSQNARSRYSNASVTSLSATALANAPKATPAPVPNRHKRRNPNPAMSRAIP